MFNVTADRTFPTGMATVGFDDDGVKAQKWPLVKDGILVGLQTNRETAHSDRREGKPRLHRSRTTGATIRSFGCRTSSSSRDRTDRRRVDQMIADVKDGVLVDGTGSFSIDQQRYNGQFGGDAFWEIKNGKKTRMVTDFTYNAITTDFWANLDAVGPAGNVGAPRSHRRREGSAGAVESPVAWLVAVPDSQNHGGAAVRVART
mgnify:CR=1 FL=1